MIDSVKKSLEKFADFSGNASRSEFWYLYLFYFLVAILAAVIDGFLGIDIIYWLTVLVFAIPVLSCNARRNHDVGKSGWFMLVPIYGVYLLFKKGFSANETNFE